MRAVIQRVKNAAVDVDENTVSEIQEGLLVLLGITTDDTAEDIDWLANKLVNLRIFNDENGVMNRSLIEEGKSLIVISQFTLYAATKKGNRPSYIKAAKPEIANPIYEQFVQKCEYLLEKEVGKGIFGADMKVSLVNDGPVTICIDTKNKE